MSGPLASNEEDLLQAALSSSFTATGLPHQSASAKSAEPPAAQSTEAPVPEAPAPSAGAGADAFDAWRAEQEAQQATFRAQSAAQRAKAEQQRLYWEQKRAAEREGAEARGARGELDPPPIEKRGSWENVPGPSSVSVRSGAPPSPSPADARDLVSGEPQGPPASSSAKHQDGSPSSSHSGGEHSGAEHSGGEHSNGEHKHEWEDLPSSLTSSFPSSFEMDTPPSPSHPLNAPAHRHARAHDPAHPSHAPVPAPPLLGGAAHAATAQAYQERAGAAQALAPLALTPSIFAKGLSARARTLAIISSLAINLFLPFVNGVMLGFGEIFAKEVLGVWIGWTRPGSSIANVGLARPRDKSKPTPWRK